MLLREIHCMRYLDGPHQSHKVRVLLANDLRYYREAIAEALRALRPEVEITTVVPGDLDSSILRLGPDVVVCSEATDIVRKNVSVWVELYPGHEAHSIVSIDSMCTKYAKIELSDLLAIIDRAKAIHEGKKHP